MNKDFHYYGTYCAARTAGYAQEEAKTIAFYAQFVDECTKTESGKLKEQAQAAGRALEPVYTVQSVSGMMHKYGLDPRPFTPEQLVQVEGIWCPFHFLPGNVQSTVAATNGEEPGRFALLCLPNSSTVLVMLNALFQDPCLEHIGMVMHILADTWAHEFFAGVPSYGINEAVGDVTDDTGNRFTFLYPADDNLDRNIFSCTPRAPRVNSLSYLGHGRMGHLPDLGYLHYHYTPVWSSQPVEKDNPRDFRSAYCQMVYVLTCIREHREFDFDVFRAAEAGGYANEIDDALSILTRKGNEAYVCAAMAERLSDELPDYSHQAYFAQGDKWDSLERFFAAAGAHKEMVLAAFPEIAQ